MAPVVRTYRGKKPSSRLKVPLICSSPKDDSFDKLFGKRRTPHVFSSSSEASASHSRLELSAESSSFRLGQSSHVFFSKKTETSDAVSLTPKGIRKTSGKKTQIIPFEKLGSCNLKRLKRGCKKLERLLLFQSTPVKQSSDTFSMLGFKFDGLRIEDSRDGADASFESCSETSNCDRLTESPSVITATAHSPQVVAPSTRRMKSIVPSGESSSDFRGFESEIMTPSILRSRYQWLNKEKSCAMVQEPLRRACSMHDIILLKECVASGSNRNAVDAAYTVPFDPSSDRGVSGPSNDCGTRRPSSVGSSRASLNSKHFTTCDEMPLTSSASSDSSRTSKDVSRDTNVTDEVRPNIYGQRVLEPLHEKSEDGEEESSSLSPRSSLAESSSELLPLELMLMPGKKYRRSLSIIKHFENQQNIPDTASLNKGRNYRKYVNEVLEKLRNSSFYGDSSDTASTSFQFLKQRLTVRRSSLMKQMTPPPRRRSTMRPTIYETPGSVFSCRNSIRDSLSALDSSASLRPDLAVSPGDPEATPRDAVLSLCHQTDYVRFSEIFKKECYSGATKLGEGVYGEVFRISRGERSSVIKIIPVEGNFLVNDAEQKTFNAILPELVISIELNELIKKTPHRAIGFVEIEGVYLVQGCYSDELLRLWEEFNEQKGSENDNPKIFGEDQLYIVIEQADGGIALESFTFSTARQAVAVFKQIAFSLAVAECDLEFEHRDLHWGNVLISKTRESKISYILDEQEYYFPTYGVKAIIIDYTLSRITYKNYCVMCCDLSEDPDLFLGTGDYQFEVYRQMKGDVENEWHRYNPITNVRWLFYLLLKMKNAVYLRKTAKIHREGMSFFDKALEWVEQCQSAKEVAVALKKR